MSERGTSIVIEGNDGTGKSTQVELLAERLRSEYNLRVLTIHEPDGPLERCKELRARIKDASIPRTPEENLAWFTESRRLSNSYGRKHYIDVGGWVLRARNHHSTIAYQGSGEGVPATRIYEATRAATDDLYMNPDLEVILYVDDEVRAQRIDRRGVLETPDTFESRDDEFQRRVNGAYLDIAEAEKLPLIEASVSVDEIHEQIMELIWLRNLLDRR